MADGGQQTGFNFPRKQLVSALRPGEIVVDFFAGGGGASEALRQALGRDPDVAVNHDHQAIGMHAANHPFTRHMEADVWTVDILREVAGRPVGWFHASPDCTHFSQAKGGQPRDRATRSLSWVVLKVAGTLERHRLAPRIISLENVKQILQWCPLVAKRDKATGRVVKLDGTVAAPGERVPLREQFLVPDKRRLGDTWRKFVAALRALGYVVEWRLLKACDYGAGTSRERLFLIARRDGAPIRWPEPTHGPGRPKPYVTAADCIDWSIRGNSIFDRPRPLAEATMRRIAKGIHRYVLSAAEPFIVPNNTNNAPQPVHGQLPTVTTCSGRNLLIEPTIAPLVTEHANGSTQRIWSGDEPLRTQCAEVKGGHFAAVSPLLVQAGHGEGKGKTRRRSHGVNDVQGPVGTIVASGGGQSVASALLVGVGGRAGQTEPRSVAEPGYTSSAKADCALATAHLVKFRGESAGAPVDAPVPVITSGAGAARPAGAAHALGVMTAFLEQAAGGPNSNTSRPRGADEPVSTIMGNGAQQRLVTANLATLRRNCDGRGVNEPVGTVCAGAEHHALVTGHLTAFGQNAKGSGADEPLQTALGGAARFGIVECTLSPEQEAGALRVAAFLMRYHGTGGQHAALDEPLTTATTKDRLALVTVTIQGTPYVIVDICLRMLRREELFRAQGFPPGYIIDRTADGTKLSNSASVKMCGNSVSPPPLAALARANLEPAEVPERMAA
jgi:DNA (cytosine-5)-methyltransferase 1